LKQLEQIAYYKTLTFFFFPLRGPGFLSESSKSTPLRFFTLGFFCLRSFLGINSVVGVVAAVTTLVVVAATVVVAVAVVVVLLDEDEDIDAADGTIRERRASIGIGLVRMIPGGRRASVLFLEEEGMEEDVVGAFDCA
jgi:hypothetical protein